MKITISLVLVLFFLIACAPSPYVKTTVYRKLPPKPEDSPIKIYRNISPKCEFEEIGTVISQQKDKTIPIEEVIDSMRVEVRKMGGDAIVDFDITESITKSSQYNKVISGSVLSGSVIKFISSGCTN